MRQKYILPLIGLCLAATFSNPVCFAAPHVCISTLNQIQFPYRDPMLRFARESYMGYLFFGEGTSARVYLGKDARTNEFYIRKLYNDSPFGVERHQYDVLGQREIKRIYDAFHGEKFEVIQGERGLERSPYEDGVMQMIARFPFVPGRTVHDIMLDPAIPAFIKQRVQANYVRKLMSLRAALATSPDVADMEARNPEVRNFFDRLVDGLPILRGTLGGGNGKFLIKSDNIIVDPYDLDKMTLVDPY